MNRRSFLRRTAGAAAVLPMVALLPAAFTEQDTSEPVALWEDTEQTLTIDRSRYMPFDVAEVAPNTYSSGGATTWYIRATGRASASPITIGDSRA